MDFVLRPGTPADIDITEATWLEVMRHASPHTRGVPSPIYYPKQRVVIREVMKRSQHLVACWTEDRDLVLGYVVFEGRAVHMLYVKSNYRRAGIAKALLEASVGLPTPKAPVWCTCYTDSLASILRTHPKFPLIVDPYLIHEEEANARDVRSQDPRHPVEQAASLYAPDLAPGSQG